MEAEADDEDEEAETAPSGPDYLDQDEIREIKQRMDELRDEINRWKYAWYKVKGFKPEKQHIPPIIRDKILHYKELKKILDQ